MPRTRDHPPPEDLGIQKEAQVKRTEIVLKDGTKAYILGDRGTLPLLRLLAYHAPLLLIEVWRGENDPFFVGVGMVNFDHSAPRSVVNEAHPPQAITTATAPRELREINIDRAQLSKLGG